MIRIFSLALGLGVGFVAGISTMRRVDDAKRAVRPTALAERLGRRVGETARRVADAFAAGRADAVARDALAPPAADVPRPAVPVDR